MALALDRQLAGFFDFLAISLDLPMSGSLFQQTMASHPYPQWQPNFIFLLEACRTEKMEAKLNSDLSAKLTPGHQTKFIEDFGFTMLWSE